MMLKMKKVISLILMIFLLCFVSSCHGKKVAKLEEFVMPETFDTSKTYHISFWAKNDSNKLQQQIYNQAVEKFEKLYPNIKVEIVQYSDYGKIYSDVITNISTRTTPNICITYPDYVATYLEGENIVVPLDDLMNSDKYGFSGTEVKYENVGQDNVIQKFLDECKINDKYYAVPFMRSSEATYINKDYVERLGFEIPEILTWDFVWDVCKKAIEEKKEKQVLYPLIYKSTDNMFIQMAYQKNMPYVSNNGEVLLFNNQTDELLKELLTYAKDGYFETFKRISYPGNKFNKGECIFAIDSTAGSTWIGANAPLQDHAPGEKIEFETVVKPVPQYDTSNPLMISQGPSICIFNKKDSQEVLASWLFAQYLLNEETQMAYSKTEGYIPVIKSALNNSEYQKYLKSGIDNDTDLYYVKIEATKLVLNNIDNTFVTPVFNGSSLVRKASGDLIEEIFNKRNKGALTEEDLKGIYNKLTSLYKLNNIGNGANENTEEDLGKLPTTSKILLGSLIAVWIGLLTIIIVNVCKKKKEK